MHFCLFFRNQSFVYSGIRKRDLRSRILEVRHKSNIKHKRLDKLLNSVVDPWHFVGTDPNPRIRSTDLRIWIQILLFLPVAVKQPTKNNIFSNVFCLLLFEGTFTLVIKDKMRNQGFSYFFAWWRKESDPDPYKIMTDPDLEGPKLTDPDPQHCFSRDESCISVYLSNFMTV